MELILRTIRPFLRATIVLQLQNISVTIPYYLKQIPIRRIMYLLTYQFVSVIHLGAIRGVLEPICRRLSSIVCCSKF